MQPILVGTAGAALVLLAYILAELKVWRNDSVRYDLFNAAGSGLLIVYAWLLNSVPFIVLNAAWLLLSLRDVVRDRRKR